MCLTIRIVSEGVREIKCVRREVQSINMRGTWSGKGSGILRTGNKVARVGRERPGMIMIVCGMVEVGCAERGLTVFPP